MPTPFQQACYDLLLQVPAGYVTTYAEIAHALGTKAYQAVGSAMHHNPHPVIVPCHRVVNRNGRLGQYAFGAEQKKRLLEQEGIVIVAGKVQDFERVLYRFAAPSSADGVK